jgi:hypothetical protein
MTDELRTNIAQRYLRFRFVGEGGRSLRLWIRRLAKTTKETTQQGR